MYAVGDLLVDAWGGAVGWRRKRKNRFGEQEVVLVRASPHGGPRVPQGSKRERAPMNQYLLMPHFLSCG